VEAAAGAEYVNCNSLCKHDPLERAVSVIAPIAHRHATAGDRFTVCWRLQLILQTFTILISLQRFYFYRLKLNLPNCYRTPIL
jgi:hypothetical protein